MERTVVADFKALSYIPPGGRNSLVGIATRYRLVGRGGGRAGEIFRTRPDHP